MGEMAERYGFYGDPSADTGGESILVADADEQFIFHILAESVEKGGEITLASSRGCTAVDNGASTWPLVCSDYRNTVTLQVVFCCGV
jgi:hypothetical protein